MIHKIEINTIIKEHSNQSNWVLRDHDETILFGQSLADTLKKTNILFLEGPLGAGKTSLVKGIAKGLNIKEPITSPTFALSHHYLHGSRALIHLDLYRLEKAQAANELFLQEEETATMLNGLIVIEWPSRLSLKVDDAYQISIKYLPHGAQGRKIQLIPST
ncbi:MULTISPECIES: tRNA (adenosine(37)-N6)-threonylcarbamoyltransferase complex ATPase subunit type 1 TsaE [unclassified Prochlorococcus]|uniref:tRNA (adenosine(37)-N6)-threonylcarbamoyltransferase complex ATPase subunit type 1 TsaE n=1 Tax=unclassified Prochlorococcus TaxID=2627481 RepID=UPI000533B482|nr:MULTISPECIES: tRNA (adenosine(37)-N6)-threonylcarbamoyltransferase complex ATPase subunit type 1 TsaE [unclassified Prochlorococcus]KGG14599.1 ATPase YjeE [Prochlorococcus sp. MIT 0602]KGG15974.1 ATPase YjeE [Prochlorococcus sp. MIT 0603]